VGAVKAIAHRSSRFTKNGVNSISPAHSAFRHVGEIGTLMVDGNPKSLVNLSDMGHQEITTSAQEIPAILLMEAKGMIRSGPVAATTSFELGPVSITSSLGMVVTPLSPNKIAVLQLLMTSKLVKIGY
jgi:hypothetical protein